MSKRLITVVAAGLIALGTPAAVHAGGGNPNGTGQPSQECEDNRPGHSSSAPGSAFNEDGVAGDHYAGEQDQNDNNAHSVSQYDVACTKIPS